MFRLILILIFLSLLLSIIIKHRAALGYYENNKEISVEYEDKIKSYYENKVFGRVDGFVRRIEFELLEIAKIALVAIFSFGFILIFRRFFKRI